MAERQERRRNGTRREMRGTRNETWQNNKRGEEMEQGEK